MISNQINTRTLKLLSVILIELCGRPLARDPEKIFFFWHVCLDTVSLLSCLG